MKIKCPRCQAALTFDVATQSMECEYCGSIFGINDISAQTGQEEYMVPASGESAEASEDSSLHGFHTEETHMEDYLSDAMRQPDQGETETEDEMTLKLFSCSCCGANLMVNETESATFCAYCGQPTLVMDRLSRQKKPEYILPFQIQKREAEQIVRSRLRKGFFVPQRIKEFKVEKLHGVYIPYRMVDVYCQDEVVIRSEVRSNKTTAYRYHYRRGLHTFHQITVDASDMLNDESSVRLEPFDLTALRPFDPAYLSGFYANCMDTPKERLEDIAAQRAMDYFHEEMKNTIKTGTDPMIMASAPYHEIEDSIYIMLPAWFVSFLVDGRNYTMMVNGQTGKCVGAVPADKKSIAACLAFLSVAITPFAIFLMSIILKIDDMESKLKALVFLFSWVGLLAYKGHKNFLSFKNSCELTNASDMKQFANDRQEGD